MKLEDALLFLESRISLSRAQESIFRGCWRKRTYPEIAKESRYSSESVKQQASRLWKSLSNEFGEKVTKVNFRQVLVRHHHIFQLDDKNYYQHKKVADFSEV